MQLSFISCISRMINSLFMHEFGHITALGVRGMFASVNSPLIY